MIVLKNVFFKFLYWHVSIVDKNAGVIVMNYGYSKDNQKVELNENDEKDRYSIQPYQLLATGAEIKGKDILEVGCIRGGGLSNMNRTFEPNIAIGVDLTNKAVKFCYKKYTSEKIKRLQADQQKLDLADNAFDGVVNIESSHRYSRVDLFWGEAYCILKPRGVLLFADFGNQDYLKNYARI